MENFRSFRDCHTLSLVASADRSYLDHATPCEAVKGNGLLNSIIMSGANASGKSNLTIAISLLRNLVLRSHLHQKGMKLNYQPFAFDPECEKRPTRLSVVFVHQGVRHDYTLAFDSDRVAEEHLYHYPHGRKAAVFSRRGQHFDFKKDRKEQEALAKRTAENVLYLSCSAQFNYEGTAAAYDWFQNGLMTLETSEMAPLIAHVIERMNRDQEFKGMVEKALQIADLGVVKVNAKITSMTPEELEGKAPPQTRGMMTMAGDKFKETDISFTHSILDRNGQRVDKELKYPYESEGTRRLFAMIGPIIDSLLEGKTLVIDELDTKLHHDICGWLVDLYHNPIYDENTKGAQLIFNTHDQVLLDLTTFRRDQIWFVEKNYDTGASALFSLADFCERKDRDVQKAYQTGRYGAVPFIGPGKVTG